MEKIEHNKLRGKSGPVFVTVGDDTVEIKTIKELREVVEPILAANQESIIVKVTRYPMMASYFCDMKEITYADGRTELVFDPDGDGYEGGQVKPMAQDIENLKVGDVNKNKIEFDV